MYSFRNDYSEGAHPAILQQLVETNMVQENGYGEDAYSLEAKVLIRKQIQNPAAQVYFVSGGTQTNMLVITSLLRTHEAVISPATGHIYTHETGAIEAVGHRVIPVNTAEGKLNPQHIETVLKEYNLRPHMVKPKLVYISNATETGTIYQKKELQELYHYCKHKGLYLFMDGARLGTALTANSSDMAITDIAKYTDVFYIGGTKNGALLGEAIVFQNDRLAPDFDYLLKQKGALLAKGRLLGVQFLTLFQTNLFYVLAAHANKMADKIAVAVKEMGYSFHTLPCTNQLFPIFPKPVIEKLQEKYAFYIWKDINEELAAVRIITSWATKEKDVEAFIADLSIC